MLIHIYFSSIFTFIFIFYCCCFCCKFSIYDFQLTIIKCCYCLLILLDIQLVSITNQLFNSTTKSYRTTKHDTLHDFDLYSLDSISNFVPFPNVTWPNPPDFTHHATPWHKDLMTPKDYVSMHLMYQLIQKM